MAEESTDPLVAPEKVGIAGRKTGKNSIGNSGSINNGAKTHGKHRRASIASFHIGDASRNNLNQKSESAISLQNVLPRYLRASTGSCHDFCKYGKKQEFGEKPWKPQRRRSAVILPNEPFVQIVVSGEQKKEKVVKPKSSLDTNNHLPVPKPSPATKAHMPKSKTSLDAKTFTSRQNASCGTKTLPSKYSPSSIKKSPSPDPPEVIKREICLPSSEVEVPEENGSSADSKTSRTEKKTADNSEKRPSPVQPKSVQIKPPSSSDKNTDHHSKNLSSPVKSKPVMIKPSFSSDNSDESLGKGKRAKVPAKIGSLTDGKPSGPEKMADCSSRKSSSSVKMKPVKVKASSSSDSMHEKGEGSSNVKTNRKITASRAAAKKALTPSAATSSLKLTRSKISSIEARKTGNLTLASYLKARNIIRRAETKTTDTDVVFEKTLHVIKKETGNNVLESVSDDHPMSLSRPKVSSLSSQREEDEKTMHSSKKADKSGSFKRKPMEVGKVQPVKVNSPKKKVVTSEDKHRSLVKLKFRSGKVVDLHSENNSPRRLRFRRARAVGAEDGNGDLRRRIFKNAGGKDDAAGAEISSEKVVLKHQAVQEKKDARGLLNNVIKETASKLVQSKKSKVKALVGAFESVISLQEIKPSLHAAN